LHDEVGYSAAELEDDAHSCATSYDDLVTFWLLGFLPFSSSRGLVVELLFTSADLGGCCELVKERDGSFVVVGGNTRL
jgi:hypothetical protein